MILIEQFLAKSRPSCVSARYLNDECPGSAHVCTCMCVCVCVST